MIRFCLASKQKQIVLLFIIAVTLVYINLERIFDCLLFPFSTLGNRVFYQIRFQPLPHPPRYSGSVSAWMRYLPHKSVYPQAVSQNLDVLPARIAVQYQFVYWLMILSYRHLCTGQQGLHLGASLFPSVPADSQWLHRRSQPVC